MSSLLRTVNLDRLDSATKYPSILTYHAIGDRGTLKEEVQVPFDSPVLLTEKIDGTNARIIACDDDYIIGSREELLTARDDLIFNPALAIVESLLKLNVPRMVSIRLDVQGQSAGMSSKTCYVLFGEVYGHKKISGYKSYSDGEQVGFRLFDVAFFEPSYFKAITSMGRDKIASWRDHGGQKFVSQEVLKHLANGLNLQLTPSLREHTLPTTLRNTHEMLKDVLTKTHAGLVEGVKKGPEGVVARTPDRKRIAKLRFEDYERTERKNA